MKSLTTIKDVADALRAAEKDQRIIQVRGPFVSVFGMDEPVGVCATAAAVIETGLEPETWGSIDFGFIMSGWTVFKTRVRHPILSIPMSLFSVVADLNDGFGWSWSRIADYLEDINEA